MKYTTVVSLLVCFFSSVVFAGRTAAQNMHELKISLDATRLPLSDVFEVLEARTGFRFVYNYEAVHAGRKVTLHAKDISLADALKRLIPAVHLRQEGSVIVIVPGRPQKTAEAFGSIRGSVTDAETGDVLPGANVVIEGTAQGTITDVNGKFSFAKVAPGAYTLVVSFISYQSKKIGGVTVTADNVSTFNVALSPSSVDIGEVVVTASVDVRYTPIQNSTEESLISDIKLSNNIVTGISNLQITRSLDRDASDVMRRVPGVTVLNNFVLVRGMDPRYNVTYLNNMLIPSTESDSRAFGFNLIPSGLIDDIKIYKAPAPELPGGFGGGVIKVNTKKGQTTRHLQIDLSTQYRTGSSFHDYYTGSNSSSKDWIAGGLNDRELPAKFYDKNYKLPDYEFYPGERVAAIRTLPPVNQLERKHNGLDKRLTINYYDSYKIGRTRLSNLTSFGYTAQRANEIRSRADRGLREWEYATDGEPLYFTPDNQTLDSTSVDNVRLSALENLSWKINDNHRIAFNVFANRNAENNTVITAESHSVDGIGGSTYPIKHGEPVEWRSVGFEYRVRDLLSGQLSGEHALGKHSVSWNIGSTSQRDYTPDWHTFLFRATENPGRYSWLLSSLQTDNNTRQRYLTDEKMDIAGLDYTLELLPAISLKAGTLLQTAHRSFSNFNYNVVVPPSGNSVEDTYTDVYQPWFHTHDLYADENFKEDRTGLNLIVTSSAASYAFDQNIVAVYLATRIRMLQNKLEFYGGMRYENEYAQLYDADGKPFRTLSTGEDLPGPEFDYYLPSANLTWNITEQHKLRGSYGKTIDRPAYRERSFARYYSIRDNVTYVGNSQLTNATLDNYDLRWEWYPTDEEFIAVGGYYKFIDKPIEMFETGFSGSARLNRSWQNKRWAELYGVELEVRKNLGFIPLDVMKRFSLIINGSYMYTTVSEVILTGVSSVDARPRRPLAGSSPYALNVNLYYEQPSTKTQLTASYNYIGERIIATSIGFVGNLHEQSQHLLDLVVIQPIGKHLRVKGGVQNLLNRDVVRWRDGNFDGQYDRGLKRPAGDLIDPTFADQADHEAERWNTGSYYSLGITATF